MTLALTLLAAFSSRAQNPERRILPGSVPEAVARLNPVESLAATQRLNLVLGLPLRNPGSLSNLLVQLYDPANPRFHQWWTPEQFAEAFAPTEEDYSNVARYAEVHGMKVTGRFSNRTLLDVSGSVAAIENLFGVKLHLYRHPTENRTFFAPDTEPTVDAAIPLLHVSGLDNFTLPRPMGRHDQAHTESSSLPPGVTSYATGSSPGGYFMGYDFRAAYAPGVTNTGAGQYIAIVDVGGPYYMLDVYMYQTNAGLSTNIVVTNILLSGWTGIPPGPTDDDGEEVLDIDMAMSMAPGATILNYEGEAHDVFNQIAIDNKAKQMTLSYGFGIDASIIQTFQQFAVQGQEFSQASGDGGADLDGGLGLTGNPYATIVGGTSLTTTSPGGPWKSDTTWSGSGGGISGYGIPTWQQGVATPGNQGSSVYRNYPDVAMPAVNIFTIYRNGTVIGATGGTSAASPLWSGFMALINQQAAVLGNSAAGFINPAIYALGKGPSSTYNSCFHDVTTGNTVNSQNPTKYYAGVGYDLCTGWGTPTGSNTISALAGVGTNDFALSCSSGPLNLVRGGVSTATIAVTRMNGLSGSVNLSVSGLPAGVSASFSPSSATAQSLLTLTASNTAAIGSAVATITGTSGGLAHSLNLNLNVALPIPAAAQAGLSSYFNRAGVYSDGRTFGGGLDGVGYAYSANLLGPAPTWGGVVFALGSPNGVDVVSCGGQTIPLPAGNYSSLVMLATAVEGSQASQSFVVTYTDNSTATFTQSLSDWAYAQNYPGEFIVAQMPYRNSGAGSPDTGTAVNIYGYGFALDQTKTVKNLKLPSNSNVEVLAVTMANAPASASLATSFNRAGIYTDGTTFTNPATGGLDGGGAAYSANLLGGSLIWSNVLFRFGPANATNVISAKGQTLALPPGQYSVLRMLATGVQGNQLSQSFVVTYSDASTSTFVQSLSDWFTPQNYPGESKALTMGHRDSSDGTQDNRTFYLYGYSMSLNSGKTVQSLRLPNNANVVVLAVSLVPNWIPVFLADPINEPPCTAGQACSGTIASSALDLNGDPLTFAVVSGPAWLSLAPNGSFSGTPLSADVGTNTFEVSVTDPGGLSSGATLVLNVTPAPPLLCAITIQGADLVLAWTGGIAPYQVQATASLENPDWLNVGPPQAGQTMTLTPTNAAAFYRIVGH